MLAQIYLFCDPKTRIGEMTPGFLALLFLRKKVVTLRSASAMIQKQLYRNPLLTSRVDQIGRRDAEPRVTDRLFGIVLSANTCPAAQALMSNIRCRGVQVAKAPDGESSRGTSNGGIPFRSRREKG
jgi:hypothetical protein